MINIMNIKTLSHDKKQLWKAWFLLACLVIACTTSNAVDSKRRVNCRKYVYAPICRGVTAKRDTGDVPGFIQDGANKYSTLPEYVIFRTDTSKQWNPTNNVLIRSILGNLLRKAAQKETDYDGNYI